MFDAPEYASYVTLCRALRLEHVFARQDMLVQPGLGGVPVVSVAGSAFCDIATDDQLIWLPYLHDWLAMLEGASLPLVGFQVSAAGTPCAVFQIEVDSIAQRTWSTGLIGKGATREEAAARLWCSVTGRQVEER